MVKDINIRSDQHTFEVSWTRPKYPPFYYKEEIICVHACNEELYLFELTTHGPDIVHLYRTQLDPNSECGVQLTAVYNNGSLDRGLHWIIYTAPTGI